MRCKACDSMLKDTAPFYRDVEVEGKLIQLVEDLCLDCRTFIDYDDDEEFPYVVEDEGYD